MFYPILLGIAALAAGYRSKHGGIISPVQADCVYNTQTNVMGPNTVPVVGMLKDPSNPSSPVASIPAGTKVVATGKVYSKPLVFGDSVWCEVIVAPGQGGQGTMGYIQRVYLGAPLQCNSGLLSNMGMTQAGK